MNFSCRSFKSYVTVDFRDFEVAVLFKGRLQNFVNFFIVYIFFLYTIA